MKLVKYGAFIGRDNFKRAPKILKIVNVCVNLIASWMRHLVEVDKREPFKELLGHPQYQNSHYPGYFELVLGHSGHVVRVNSIFEFTS